MSSIIVTGLAIYFSISCLYICRQPVHCTVYSLPADPELVVPFGTVEGAYHKIHNAQVEMLLLRVIICHVFLLLQLGI